VGLLRDLGLEIIQDPEDAGKLLITNLPFENPHQAEAERLAGRVAAHARLVVVEIDKK
jgi:hypothetical protein